MINKEVLSKSLEHYKAANSKDKIGLLKFVATNIENIPNQIKYYKEKSCLNEIEESCLQELVDKLETCEEFMRILNESY